jgi:poly(A) polymerase
MLKRLISKLTRSSTAESAAQINVQNIARKSHGISRTQISENALKVLYRLQNSGFQAHLVGGGVRDLLLGQEPKDFDITTDAKPEEVHRLFRNSRLIGRRFRLVHVVFGRDVIEVATFRSSHDNAQGQQQSKTNDSGMLLRDNVYGTIDEDAVRRDFTINALYYNVKDFSVNSYEGGIQDINNKSIRMIGDPETRYREDPVRMLRAVRFAGKLGFKIEKKTDKPIKELAPLLRDIPAPRLFEEALKLFMAGYAHHTFKLLEERNLFAQLFPQTQACIQQDSFYRDMVVQALKNSDLRVSQGKSLTPAFLLSVFLWPVMLEKAKLLQNEMPAGPAMQQAAQEVISLQQKSTSIPKRFVFPMRDIWDLQHRLIKRLPKNIDSIYSHERFRAAYEFILLREDVGESLEDTGQWWTDYQEENPREHIRPTRSRYDKNRGNRSDDRKPRRRPQS